MGNNFCGPDARDNKEFNIFNYSYGEDDKEIKIKHLDSIACSLESIRPSLTDCENRLKQSEKRFKDITLESEPIILSCDDRQLHCHFERPEAFLKRDADLRNKIYKILDKSNCRPSNIVIGDQILQYFGVFLCYLSNNPEMIDRIILTSPNSYGIAAIHMMFQGKREVIFIDDYILCNEQGPLFSKPIKSTDMWPCLLEKAWFKVKSTFKTRIQRVHPIEVFKVFLSFPLKLFTLTESLEQDKQMVGKNLIENFTKNSNFGCVVTSKAKPTHKIGLSGRKHFYLMKILQIEGRTLFYLRNPCGHFDFRGLINEIPEHIEQYIIKATGERPALGNFLLAEQEFYEQIQSFFMVYYSAVTPYATEIDINFAGGEANDVYLRFTLQRSGPMAIRLQQMNRVDKYDPLTYLLIDEDRKTVVSGEKNEEGCFGVESTNFLNSMHQNFMAGNYIMRLKKKPEKIAGSLKRISETSLKSRDLLIAAANEDITFEWSSSPQFKLQFQESLRQIAIKNLAVNKKNSDDEIEHVVLWVGDIVLVYVNKLNSGKDAMNLEVYFPDLKNLECLSHKIGKGYSSIPPFKQDVLIIFEKIKLTEQTSLGTYSLSPF